MNVQIDFLKRCKELGLPHPLDAATETASNGEDNEGNEMSGYSGGTGMNAREFYEEFKAMLDFVGVGFSGMQDAIVTIRDGKIFVTAGNRSARLDVPEESE